MKKYIKRILFSVKSQRNIFWDNTEIDIGCEVIIPNKFTGDTPLCVISHGSGGLGSDTELFVDSLTDAGIACLCVDSFTGRNISSLSWDSQSSYISPKVRAFETMKAVDYIKSNIDSLFQVININRISFVGFSWGADTLAQILGHHMDNLSDDAFFALCYGNLWPFESAFYNAKNYNVKLYHGSDDNWTSSEKSKIFANETNSQCVEFFNVTHGFCKQGYENDLAKDVIINHHADFPIPTEMTEVYNWVQQGKVWKDTDWKKVDAVMTFDPMATQQVIADLIDSIK